MRVARRLLLLSLGLLLAGCAAQRRVAPPSAPPTLPSPTELRAALAARRQDVRSLRALAHLRYHDPQESSASREAIVVARPDRLRVEVLSLFGSMFVLTADDGMMTAYARRENTVYRGHTTPENLWRYARLGLPVNELVDIVLGTPELHSAAAPQVSFDEAAHAVRLQEQSADGSQLVWFSAAGLPVAAEARDASGAAEWRATFADYQTHDRLPVAMHLNLELPLWQRSLEIVLDDVDLNPTLDQSVFALQTPPGSTVIDLDRAAD